jgi:hypothetical protein
MTRALCVGAMEFRRAVKVIKKIIFEININSSLAHRFFNPLTVIKILTF